MMREGNAFNRKELEVVEDLVYQLGYEHTHLMTQMVSSAEQTARVFDSSISLGWELYKHVNCGMNLARFHKREKAVLDLIALNQAELLVDRLTHELLEVRRTFKNNSTRERVPGSVVAATEELLELYLV